MSPEALRLHPEVLEIVREVAAQPGSTLLRARRSTSGRAFAATHAQVAGFESWMSRAERHLVQVHREEVAFALREAAWFRLSTGREGRARVHRTVTPDTALVVPSEREVRAHAGRALDPVGGAASAEARDVLERLVSPSGAPELGPLDLLRVAHRLVPSERGRILAGSAFALDRAYGAAATCFVHAVRSSLPPEQLAVVWNNLADVLDESGRPDQALRAARIALRLLPGLVFGEAGRLWYAIRTGDAACAREAAASLDAMESKRAGTLDEVATRWRERREESRARLAAEQHDLVLVLREGAGAGSGRFIDAIT